ncbi:MAG: HAD hydrolase-like protein, partial [Nitrospinales bacterium]
MKNIRLFVFDFDGTLVDSKHDIAESVNHTLADLGYPQLPEETIISYIGDGVQTLLTRALAPHPFDDIPKAQDIFTKHYEKHLLDRTEFYPNCRETLNFFSQKKYAIFSNKPTRFIKSILTGLD